MKKILEEISGCSICSPYLELGPRPVVAAHANSKIIIIGQAPGTAVHKSGIPWDDKSGNNLRSWMAVSKSVFYDPEKIAIIPMGFCYPGKGKSGDLPPRKECAPIWHNALLEKINSVKLILLVGKYAQDYYLKEQSMKTLTLTVKHFKDYLPKYFTLPHPSPRNNIWQAKNEWFIKEVVPTLQEKVKEALK